MYVSPQGLLVAGNDPQLNPNDKGLIAAVLPQRGAVRVIAKGIHQPWAFANGQDIQITAGAGMQTAGVGANGLSNQTVRLHSTANATNTVWERPVKQVSVLVVFIKYGNASGATPLFENGSPNTAPYEAWGMVDASGVLQFGYSAGGTFRFLQAEAGSVGLGQVIVALATYNGATARIYKNGVLRNSGSQTGDLTYPNSADRGPGLTSFWNYPFNNRALNGRIFLAALWDVGLSEGYATEITRSPQAAFEAVLGQSRLWLPMPVPAGGSTLTATLIEATAGADLASASAVLSASLLDATAGTDTTSPQPTVARSLVDAAAGTDIASAQPTVARSLVDAAGGVDLVNSGVVVNGTLVEGVSAVDLSSALATLSVTVNEAVTVVELLAATRIANVAATEAVAGVDISSTGTSLSGSLVDAVVSVDALSAAATLVASVLEAGGVVDQIHAAAQLVVLLTESAAGSDVVSRPAVYSVTATELVAALDVLAAAIGGAPIDAPARYTLAAKSRLLTITAAARRLEIRK